MSLAVMSISTAVSYHRPIYLNLFPWHRAVRISELIKLISEISVLDPEVVSTNAPANQHPL